MKPIHSAQVIAVARSAKHAFSKTPTPSIELAEGMGVVGDAHQGATVQHRSRVAKDPTQPNLRQVHLIHGELLDALNRQGFALSPGDLGENVTTRGVDLLSLCRGSQLRFADGAVVEITGLRNPCAQIEKFRSGLLAAVLDRDDNGELIRKAGVMGVVTRAGSITVGDAIAISAPQGEQLRLTPV